MSPVAAEVIGAVGAMLGIVFLLVGFLIKYALLPWILAHVVDPLKETSTTADELHRQVTVNKHVSATPTLLDKLDTVSGKVDDLGLQITTAARMFDGHIDRSAEEWGRLWGAIEHLRDHHNREHHREEPPT